MTTKSSQVGRYDWDYKGKFDFTRERVLKGFEDSLRFLQLPYVDLLQVIMDTW